MGPLGTVIVYVVSGTNAPCGVKVIEAPATFQLPATGGEIVGSGEVGATGAEKVSVTGAIPLTPVDAD